jgi:hypothetical protein
MARANTSVLERAAGGGGDGELLLKLGVNVAQSTVAMYLVRGRPPPGQNWKTFLRNRDRRNGSARSADGRSQAPLCVRAWTTIAGLSSQRRSHPIPPSNGLRRSAEAFPWQETPQYLRRDRDAVYGYVVRQRLAAMGIRDRPTTARSPWQNGYIERPVGSIPPRMHRSCHRARRRPSAQNAQTLRRLPQPHESACATVPTAGGFGAETRHLAQNRFRR